ncbi:bifunctional ArgH domain protein, partial [Vibrio parahaemolyticus V-223/04]
MRPMPAS